MALVAYDCSDLSEESDDNEVAKTSFKLPARRSNNSAEETDSEDDSSSNDSDDDRLSVDISFSSISKPQDDKPALYVDESKVKSSKSEMWKKLVSLPKVKKKALVVKKPSSMATNSKESTLLSLLPSPSSESMKTKLGTVSHTSLLPTVLKNKIKPKQNAEENDNDEQSDSNTDFFSLSEIGKEVEYDTSEIDSIMVDSSADAKARNVVHAVRNLDENVNERTKTNYVTPEPQKNFDLDEEAVLKLCGRKRKNNVPDDIQVIDIHEDSILAETRRNLSKRLTEEVSYKPIRAGPSTLSKRKHQITYLAFQAKERELELKNQWAQNRFNKRQTQSKYGF